MKITQPSFDVALEEAETAVVLDARAGRALARDGEARSDQVARRAEYDACVLRACRAHPTLCADQVWEVRGAIPNSKGAASGLGAAMRRAVEAGWMVPTGNFRLSERPKAHRKPLPEYRSLVYGLAALPDNTEGRDG